ncbi:hypothetical protein [Flavobacterium sp. KACC 22761]|uniref:hypothetical protein n=1 Tax=Flavobacterium sp. KACC 22761 TaxID=3092665 RepID=UPI002A74AD45|nr:hypothetical protein [Flavobacterium sp. KACC 22761]WPO78478.1 hypothetical protein SCB73_19645 [Flavobacterium sp. KACC 22761]
MKKIIFTLITVFTLMQSFAQGGKTVVVGGNQTGDSNATFEIFSQNGTKGFMPPRFTENQMKTLQPTLGAANKGLTVFNTDESCLQTWKGTEWSECDAISLAKFTYDCSASGVKGSYYEGVPVGINNYIEITATVVKAGTYTFYTETVNGVRFSYTGIVATVPTGPIKIQIPAIGTPTSVNAAVGYRVYDQSGKEICNVSNFTIPVTENNADFTISCDETQPVGTFTEGQPVNPVTNGVSLQLDVADSGYYSLHTNVVGANGADTGMWFEGTGYVSTASAARIILSAKGTPQWGTDGKLTFTLYDKNNVAVGCNFTITLQSTKAGYTLDCSSSGAVVNGVFVETKGASSANYLALTLNVTKTGPWKMTTDVVKGVYFSGVGSFDTTGSTTVNLYGNGQAEAGSAGLYNFKILDAANKNAELCTPASKIDIQPNQATMVCNSPYPIVISTMKVNTTISGGAATISMPVDFSSTGPYNISATSAGVTIKAQGTVTQIATPTTITFTAFGKPTQANNDEGIAFTLTDASGETCVRYITIVATKGSTKTYPANSCKDAMADNGGAGVAPNGEYWIKPVATEPVMKTLCDMSNGQTLVWSYSEQTAKNVYNMTTASTNSNTYSLASDMPVNNTNFDNGIKYDNFRMSLLAMRSILVANGSISSLTSASTTANNKWRFRVVSTLANASKIDDANAQNNYIEFNPNSGYGFTATTTNGWHNFTGKLKGVSISSTSGVTKYNGVNTGNNSGFVGTPQRQMLWGSIMPVNVNSANYFGGFNTNAEVSGHFMDCNNGQVTCSGANLVPSSANKVIQVFVF